ncbi:YwgA family protein [Lentibacillus saliphilus]|uniref:YwgA family protein n=1 Tax=Lentibacillus saliphilus TaxID=2737028 RepID=UPI001C2F662D|nr:YwgA family protein [Lentibacillus saliphilus]
MLSNHVKLMQFFSDIKVVAGRKKLQKMIYILQACGVPFEEKFAFHKFGPYSEELSLRMEELCNLGFITEDKMEKSNYVQYQYTMTSDGVAFLEQFPLDMPDLHPYVELLQGKSSRFLELVATMLYFQDLSRHEVQQKVHIVKPKQKYNDKEFAEAWSLIDKLVQ